MSRAQVDKLNVLLARVRERRAEPRLLPVRGANALETANTNLAQRDRPLVEVARVPEPTQPEPRRTSSIQPAIELDFEAPRTEPPLALKTPTSTVPPAAAPPAERATTEVLPPTQARFVPSPAQPFDAAVKVVSSPRVEVPKSFGELLELSLSLRPKP
jgi:hypothetical protein